MAKVPDFSDDLNIIASLGVNPGPDNGLTPQELQAKFDEAALKIQQFINEQMTPIINAFVASSDGLLPVSGGKMTGNIDMDGKNRVVRLATPENAGDAATKDYVDKKATGYFPAAGGTLNGPLDMAGNNISGLPAPEADDNPATKGYADKLVVEKVNGSIKAINAKLFANQWDGKFQTVNIAEIKPKTNVWVGEDGNDVNSVITWANSIIRCCDQGDGWLKFCYYGDDKPENDVAINIFAEVGA